MYSVYCFVRFGNFENDWSQRNLQYSVYSLKLIGNKGTNRIVSDLVNILKMIGLEGTLRFVQCVQFETDGNKGTKSIVSDLVNILKMIGLEGTLRFVQCVQFCTVCIISFSSISVSHTKHRLLEIQKHL